MSKACPLSALVSPPDCNEDGPLQPPPAGEYLGCRGIVILFRDLPKAHSGMCAIPCVYMLTLTFGCGPNPIMLRRFLQKRLIFTRKNIIGGC